MKALIAPTSVRLMESSSATSMIHTPFVSMAASLLPRSERRSVNHGSARVKRALDFLMPCGPSRIRTQSALAPGMTDSIAAQVAALPKTPTPELKQMWRELFDREPSGFSRNYLISRVAYRIQELAYDGLKPATRAKLDALADALDPKAARKRVINGPVVGTRLIREWRGVEHKVTVLADGFEWEGRRCKSLSAVARAITGTRWNGLAFFGVKRHGGGS